MRLRTQNSTPAMWTGDVDDIKIKRIKIGEPFVLGVGEMSATIAIDGEVEYVADVSYLNDDEGTAKTTRGRTGQPRISRRELQYE